MPMHAIILETPDSGVANRIAAQYPNHYSLNETCFFVHTEDLSSKVAEKIDIKRYTDAEGAAGVVVKLNGARSGLARPDFWEWFESQDR